MTILTAKYSRLYSLIYAYVGELEILLPAKIIKCAKNLFDFILGYSFMLTLSHSISVQNDIDWVNVVLNFEILKSL